MKDLGYIGGYREFDTGGLVIEQAEDSLLVTARAKILLPESRLVLPDQASERESALLKSICGAGGGAVG